MKTSLIFDIAPMGLFFILGLCGEILSFEAFCVMVGVF